MKRPPDDQIAFMRDAGALAERLVAEASRNEDLAVRRPRCRLLLEAGATDVVMSDLAWCGG